MAHILAGSWIEELKALSFESVAVGFGFNAARGESAALD
jgi:hypothetical protein